MRVLFVCLFVFCGIARAQTQGTSSLFKDLCPALNKGKEGLCTQLQSLYFSGQAPKASSKNEVNLFPTSNALFEVIDSPADSLTVYRVLEDPNKMASFAYCYFSFRKWLLNPISTDQMSLTISGFSIIKSETAGYAKWLTTSEGKTCVKKVKSESDEDVVDLEKYFDSEKQALLFVNPLALVSLSSSLDHFKGEMKKIVNHERVHVIQGLCKNIDSWSEGVWKKLKPEESKSFEKTYPGYKWSDSKIAGRESVAYTFEEDFGGFLKKVEPSIKICKLVK